MSVNAKELLTTAFARNKSATQPSILMLDLDGTLVDSKNLYFVGVPIVVKRFLGLNIKPGDFMDLWGQGIQSIFIRFIGENQNKQKLLFEMHEYFEEWFIKNHDSCVSEYKGIKSAIKNIKDKGYTVGIVTNRPQKRAELAYGLSFGGFIDFIIGGDRVAKKKPAGDIINLGVEVNNGEKGYHFYLGDNALDIDAARNSKYNVASLGALWGCEKPKDLILAKPKRLFNTVGEFNRWFCS